MCSFAHVFYFEVAVIESEQGSPPSLAPIEDVPEADEAAGAAEEAAPAEAPPEPAPTEAEATVAMVMDCTPALARVALNAVKRDANSGVESAILWLASNRDRAEILAAQAATAALAAVVATTASPARADATATPQSLCGIAIGLYRDRLPLCGMPGANSCYALCGGDGHCYNSSYSKPESRSYCAPFGAGDEAPDEDSARVTYFSLSKFSDGWA